MKKILNLLLATPIIFLTSCSSGGGDTTPENDITGVWQLTESELNGVNAMPLISQALYYYHSNGTYESEVYFADGTSGNGVGKYSISNGTINLKAIVLDGAAAGLYQDNTGSFNWINENEISGSGYYDCSEGTLSSKSGKTTNSLGSAPSMPVIGVWRATEINLAGQDLMAPYSQVLYYFWANGVVGVEYYNSDGIDDWSVGTYTISSDQTTLTMSLEDLTASYNIIKLEIDKAELYTPNLDGLGAYSVKVDRAECIALSNWKK